MKPTDPLSNLLRSWDSSQPEPSADFGRSVWARIEAARSSSGFWGFAARLTRPAVAAGALAASLVVGTGSAVAYEALTRNDRIASQYAQSIDPLQMGTDHTSQ